MCKKKLRVLARNRSGQNRKLLLILLSVFTIVHIPDIYTQTLTLSDGEIKAAVDLGVQHKKDHFGLHLEDQTINFWNAMANSGKPVWAQDEAKGFSIEAFTPKTWISECAAQSTRQYIPFTIQSVTNDMRSPILYIVVHARHFKRAAGLGIGASGGAVGGESVSHVVLRSEDKKIIVQPTKEEVFNEGDQNVFGAKVEFDGVRVEFPLEDVAKLRSASPDGEFYVTVVGEKSEKNFKIKKKHFEKLRL